MQLFDSYVLFIIIVLPLTGAALIMAMPGEWENRIRWVASAFGLLVMLLTFYVFLYYYLDPGGYQFERTWNWLALPGPWSM